MPEATTNAIHIHPNKGGYDFAIVTKEHKVAAWVTPTNPAWFAMACAAQSAGRNLRIEYDKFVDGPDKRDFYQGVSSVAFA